MNSNLIDEWKTFIVSEKWNKVLSEIPIFNQVDNICNTLLDFFPFEDFEKNKIKKENWISHILLSKNLSSLSQLYGITELLKYYKKLNTEEKKSFRLITKRDNSINYKELRNILFEIFVNYILYKNNLSPSCKDYYYDNKGVLKPLDSSFVFNNKKYIVECTKLYSEKYALFREFSTRIALKFKKRGETQIIYNYEMISGYIVLKTDKELRINLYKAEQDFNKLFKTYFQNSCTN
jgi:hypothetical protein